MVENMFNLFIICLIAIKVVFSVADIAPPRLLKHSNTSLWFHLEDASHDKDNLRIECQGDDNTESYSWTRNNKPIAIGFDGIDWEHNGQSGSIIINNPKEHHQGYYQCFASNILGTAVSDKIHLQLGSLEHFSKTSIQIIQVNEGDPLTLSCRIPYGTPKPQIIWLYRDSMDTKVIETVKSRHIIADVKGKLHFTSVEVDDGRKNLIYECAATSPVLHGEYRSGDRFQLKVIKRKKEDIQSSIQKMFVSDDVITVRTGEQLKLQCIFGGRPLPKVIWSKLDGELPLDRINNLKSYESDFGQSLVINNIVPEDAGRYECRSRHLVHSMNVRIMVAPYWEYNPPKDETYAEEKNAEIECLAKGQPIPIILWSLNGIYLHDLPDDSRRVIMDHGRILKIRRLNHDIDTGVYQCNVSNPLGSLYANAYIHVKAHAPKFRMPANRQWKAVIRSNVMLDCDVDAAPEAIVRWVDSNDRPLQVMEGKTKLFPNHTFVIYDVNTNDEGLYYCNVSNKYGINRATNKLRVYKPTYFVRIPTPKRLTLEAGENAEVFCEAVADPRLKVQYKWSINGQTLNGSEYYEILPDRLRFRSVRGRHSGIIDCAAITEVDVKLASMQLIVKDVPAHPIMQPIHCTERKATIKWKPSSDHGDVIKKYLVEMFTDFKKGIWEVVYEEINVNRESFTVDITLTPWVNYTFRVVAINSHGRSDVKIEGQGREEWMTCQTNPSFPYTNPSDVMGEGTEPDNLVIRWKPLDRYYWNAPNMQYLIHYKLDEAGTGWTDILVEDSLANFTIVRDQPTFRKYLIKVQAVNSVGPSIVEPEIFVGYSGEDVPSESPMSFRVANHINFTTLNFTWDPVDAKTVNGHFQGYEIEYWKTGYAGYKRSVRVAANVTHRVINTFKAVTNYTAHIRTRNKRLKSVPGDVITFEMPEGPPGRVHNFRVHSVGSTAILVEWDPPKESNGRIRGYFLQFENDRGEIEETYVIHKQRHYLHEKSIPDTGYKVSVWAETKAGEGAATMRPVRTWPIRPPDEPVFKVRNMSTDSMLIEWVPNNSSVWRMPGAAFYMNYSVEGAEEWSQSEIIYLPERLIEIKGLKEDTRYYLQGIAKDGPRKTESIYLPIRTNSRDYERRLKQDSLRSAAWFIAILGVVGIGLCTICITFIFGKQQRKRRFAVRRKEIEIAHQRESEEEKKFLEYHYGYKN